MGITANNPVHNLEISMFPLELRTTTLEARPTFAYSAANRHSSQIVFAAISPSPALPSSPDELNLLLLQPAATGWRIELLVSS